MTLLHSHPVRKLPACLPGMGAKRHALRGSAFRQEMSESFFDFVLESRVSLGSEQNSYVKIASTSFYAGKRRPPALVDVTGPR